MSTRPENRHRTSGTRDVSDAPAPREGLFSDPERREETYTTRRTVKPLAEQHGVSRALVYVWAAERRFAVSRRGRILIDDEFDAFLAARRRTPARCGRPVHIRPMV